MKQCAHCEDLKAGVTAGDISSRVITLGTVRIGRLHKTTAEAVQCRQCGSKHQLLYAAEDTGRAYWQRIFASLPEPSLI